MRSSWRRISGVWPIHNFRLVLVETIADAQIGKHFDLPGERAHTVPCKGTRAGDSLADVILSGFWHVSCGSNG